MLWWAFERQARDDRDGVAALLTDQGMLKHPIVRDVLLERYARLLASNAGPADFATCARLLALASEFAATSKVINGMELGLQGRRVSAVPSELSTRLKRLTDDSTQRANIPLLRLAARLGDESARKLAQERVGDARAKAADRSSLVELLGQIAHLESLPVLLALVDDKDAEALRPAVVNALGSYQEPKVAARLIAAYPKLSASIRDRVLSLLCTRPAWASALLDALAAKTINPRDVRPPQILQIVGFHDSELTARIEKVWGRVPGPGSPEKVRRIAEVRGFLPEGDKGKAARGAPVFKEQCAVCHKLFNEGENIGPDLTGAERGNLEFLLTSLVDPSAMIRKEYQSQAVALRDGRVLTGLILEESGKSLTLIDSNRQKTVISRDDVEEMRPSPISLMPEGLLDKLPEDKVRDLFRYLQSSGPAK